MKVGHRITINASAQDVWRVATDINSWPAWTPTVTAARRLDTGSFGLHSRASLKQPNLPAIEWTVSEYELNKRFVWGGRMRGMPVSATHEVWPNRDGCESQLYFEGHGPVAFVLWPLIKGQITSSIVRENEGLKAYCELKSGLGAIMSSSNGF